MKISQFENCHVTNVFSGHQSGSNHLTSLVRLQLLIPFGTQYTSQTVHTCLLASFNMSMSIMPVASVSGRGSRSSHSSVPTRSRVPGCRVPAGLGVGSGRPHTALRLRHKLHDIAYVVRSSDLPTAATGEVRDLANLAFVLIPCGLACNIRGRVCRGSCSICHLVPSRRISYCSFPIPKALAPLDL